jgi:hypothetical protein
MLMQKAEELDAVFSLSLIPQTAIDANSGAELKQNSGY